MMKNLENKYPKMFKLYDKIIFIIEFVLSIALTYGIYKIIYIKHYVGFWSGVYIGMATFLAIILLWFMIINVIRYKKIIEKLFLTFIIPIGMAYMIFLMPYQAPDEAGHIIRAYETYRGEFISSLNEEGKHRANTPKHLANLNISNLSNYQQLMQHLETDTDYTEKTDIYCDAQSYPGVLYIASGFGMLIGEIFNCNIIISMYLARICNFIVFLILSYLSIKNIPFGKLILSTYFAMPMMLQQGASVSPDAIINPSCIFLIAYILKLIFSKKDLTYKNIIIVLIFSVFLAIAKVVYMPIVFLLLLIIPNKNISKKKKIVIILTSIIVAVAVGGSWYLFQGRYTDERRYVRERNINSTEQLKYIIQQPIEYVKTLKNIIQLQGMDYFYDIIGARLGWLNIEIAEFVTLIYLMLLVMSAWLENCEVALNIRQKIWAILITVGIIFLIFLAMYLGWTEVGAALVIGIQGRYFIPVAILVLLCLCMKHNYVKIKGVNIIYMLLISGLNLCAINTVINFFLK